MNFHKTIGFLATLLLMLGIGVPDVFAAEVGSITLRVTETQLRESAADASGNAFLHGTLKVVRTAGSLTSFTINAPTIDVSQRPGDTRTITVSAIEELTDATTDPPTYTALTTIDLGTSSTKTIPIRLTLAGFQANTLDLDDLTVKIMVTGGEADDGDAATTEDTLTPGSDMFRLQDDYVDWGTGAADVTNGARDAEGFRVVITSPTGDTWAKGNGTVKVEVRRRTDLAPHWGRLNGLAVALYDDTVSADKIDPVEQNTSTELAKDKRLGVIALDLASSEAVRVKVHSLASRHISVDTLVTIDPTGLPATALPVTVAGTANTQAEAAGGLGADLRDPPTGSTETDAIQRVSYRKSPSAYAYDTLVFHFKLRNIDIPDGQTGIEPGTGGSFEGKKVYAVAAIVVRDGNDPGSDLDVYHLDSRDTETKISRRYPNAYRDVVGGGGTIRIDNVLPSASIVTAIDVKLNDDYLVQRDPAADISETDDRAGIGDKIEIEISGDAAHRFRAYREDDLVIELIGTEAVENEAGNNNAVSANKALKGYKKTFEPRDIIRSGGILKDPFTVTMNMFKRTTERAATVNGTKLGNKKDFEDDNVQVMVKVTVLDEAKNAKVQVIPAADPDRRSPRFIVDSKPPTVTIKYPKSGVNPTSAKERGKGAPADSTRFTARISQEYDFVGDAASNPSNLSPLIYTADEETIREVVYINADSLVINDTAPDEDKFALLVDDSDGERIVPKSPAGSNLAKHSNPTKTVKLRVYATDLSGNRGEGMPNGGDDVYFDADPPQITDLFPNNEVLGQYGNIINADTRDPSFKINEEVDSLLVRYHDLVNNGNSRDKVGTIVQLTMVNKTIEIPFDGADGLIQEDIYELQVYARDLAGNIGTSDLVEELTYDENFENPAAGAFTIVAEVRDNTKGKNAQSAADYAKPTAKAKMDSIVAGQALRLTITALDETLTEQAGEDRPAVIYNQDGVVVKAQDAMGNMLSDVTFWGEGVTPAEGGGSATLDGANWFVGERQIFLAGTVAQTVHIVVSDMTSTDMEDHFSKSHTVEVDAADFQSLMITATDENVMGTDINVWGDFELNVVPTDKYGNPSLKVFLGSAAPKTGGVDSLNILDTRIKAANNTHEYERIYVELEPNYSLDGFSTRGRPIFLEGRTYIVEAPDRRGRILEFDASIDDRGLEDNDERSEDVTEFVEFTIAPNAQDSELAIMASSEEVTVTAGSGSAMVTASGKFDEESVEFTVEVTADDPTVVTHSQEGDVLTVTATDAATVSVTATDGVKTTDAMTITFVVPDEPMRIPHWADAEETVPIYLVYDQATGPPDYTVGPDDLMALLNSFGAEKGDDRYNVQADLNDDDRVTKNPDIFPLFFSSYGQTAMAPASKPIVLLPGVNENAEFSLSLGSERVVAGELVALDVSLANVQAVMGYGFALNYETDKFEFVSVAPAGEDLLKSTGGETLLHHVVADGQVEVVTGMYDGTAVSGGGDVVRFVFRVLREFEDNARFEIANGVVFDPSQLQNPAVVAGVLELQSTPREFALHQNFPNPFNPDTTIKYDLAESADVTLQIYSVLGQVVRTLVASEAQNAGRYQIRWNGMDDRGVPVSSGVYFYRISADGKFDHVRKLMLLK